MAIDGSDLSSTMNQLRLNNANSLLSGLPSTSSSSNPISGDIIQAWTMRGANGAAYRKLLEAQETGSIKPKNPHNYELMSDKYFNDSYTKDEAGNVSYTYKPETTTTAADGDLLSQLEAMRNIASAASSNPNSINDTYANMFNTMRQNVAGALVTKSDSSTTTKTGEAQAANLTSNVGFRYLDEQQSFTIAGKAGEKSYTFEEGSSLSQIAEAINADSEATGVKAEVVLDASGNATDIKLASTATGKDAFIRVDQTAGSMFAAAGASASAAGVDATEEKTDVVAKGGDAVAALATGASGGKVSGAQEFTIAGANGSKTFKFEAGTDIEDVAAAINEASEELGIRATAIRNSAGDVEGLGLETLEMGQNQYIKVTQKEGYLFTAPGQSVSVYGQSENPDGANAVNSLSQFGQIKYGGQSYSFADLGPGGKISLDSDPDIAVAIIDQAIRDLYSGAAELKGVDMEEAMLERSYVQTNDDRMGSSAVNAVDINNFGSTAITNWINQRLRETES